MAVKFSCDEVLEMGLQIERNGRRFYARAAGAATDPDVAALLGELAEMESDHERIFADLKGRLPAEGLPEAGYDPYGETALYLRAAADTHVFNVYQGDPEVLAECDDPLEVVKMALQFEKDSVVFFLGLADMVPEQLGRPEVEALVQEEMRHITQLNAKLEELRARRA